jgi:hypothetical protein
MLGLSASSSSKSLYEEVDECDRKVAVCLQSQLLSRVVSIGGTYRECGVVVGKVWGFVDVWRGVLELGLITDLYLESNFHTRSGRP